MQKIFNNKVMAILGLITSIYVIAFLILLIFATMTLLSVATLFNVFMWISIVASVLVIVGLLYTKFGEKCNWTKKGIILLIAHAVSLGVLLAKGVEIMNMFAKFSALYNNLKQYGGSELNSAGNSVGSLASLERCRCHDFHFVIGYIKYNNFSNFDYVTGKRYSSKCGNG